MEAVLKCVKCKAPLVTVEHPEAAAVPFNTGATSPCPACGAETMIEIYPAMFRPPDGTGAGDKIVSSEEAACFYHPQKRAAVPCDSCGRFLCALCDVELQGQHLCPNCLQSGKKKGKIKNLENERVLYDRIALMLSLAPLTLILIYFSFITAPMSLYFAIRYWNSPSSVVPRRSRLRFVIAIILSLLQIAGWIFLIAFWIHKS